MEGRKEDGTFAEGHKLAPGRKPSVFQSYGARAEHYLTTLTRSQILAIGGDAVELDKYSSFDALVLEQLANTFKTPKFVDPHMERERMFDRAIGKPKQALTGGDEDDKPLFPQNIGLVVINATTGLADTDPGSLLTVKRPEEI